MIESQKEMWLLPLGSCCRVDCEKEGKNLGLRSPSNFREEGGTEGRREERKEDGSEEEKAVYIDGRSFQHQHHHLCKGERRKGRKGRERSREGRMLINLFPFCQPDGTKESNVFIVTFPPFLPTLLPLCCVVVLREVSSSTVTKSTITSNNSSSSSSSILFIHTVIYHYYKRSKREHYIYHPKTRTKKMKGYVHRRTQVQKEGTSRQTNKRQIK